MAWLFLGVALLGGFLLILRWYVSAEPKTLVRALRWGGLAVGIVITLFLVVTGRFGLLWMAAAFLLPWIMRLRMLRDATRMGRGPTGGQSSEVETRFVRMRLDHDTGEMDGQVREGPYQGRLLSELSLDELIRLWRDAVGADRQSAQVIQAYLDRTHEDWEAAAASGGGRSGGASDDRSGNRSGGGMTEKEAYDILGLQIGAGAEEIKRAHRRLMQHYHPDRGGSDYLAAKINEAKDILLGE